MKYTTYSKGKFKLCLSTGISALLIKRSEESDRSSRRRMFHLLMNERQKSDSESALLVQSKYHTLLVGAYSQRRVQVCTLRYQWHADFSLHSYINFGGDFKVMQLSGFGRGGVQQLGQLESKKVLLKLKILFYAFYANVLVY